MLAFLEHLVVGCGLAAATASTYLAGVANRWLESGIPSGWPVYTKRVKLALRGAERISCTRRGPTGSRKRLPFNGRLVRQAQQVACGEYLANGGRGDPIAAAAAVALGFYFLLRRSEYLCSGRSRRSELRYRGIRQGDLVLWRDDVPVPFHCVSRASVPPGTASRVSLVLPCSKGDQLGRGDPRSCTSRFLCNVLLEHAYKMRDDHHAVGNTQADAPVFPPSRLLAVHVRDLMRLTAVRAGLDPQRINCHSLRIGGLTHLSNAGLQEHLLLYAGRWRSPRSVGVYFRATRQAEARMTTALDRADMTAAELPIEYGGPRRRKRRGDGV